jgi:MFS family permease
VGRGRTLPGVSSLFADITPLRTSASFRRLWFGLAVSGVGNQLTLVALAYQTYVLTHSTLIVGLVGLVELAPSLIGGIGGGAVIDAVDRRSVLIFAQVMLAVSSAALAVNAFLPHPKLWVIFIAAAAAALFQGLDFPTRLAIMPMILPAEQLSSAYALQSLVSSAAVVIGPALAGLVIALGGTGAAYCIDVGSYAAVVVAAALLPALPLAGGGTPTSFRSIIEGPRFVRSERLLLATFYLDLVAMTFGMPKAVFPALGIGLFNGGAGTVGLLFAAPGAGALAGSMFSGWATRTHAKARALVLCMLAWGAAIAAFGIVPVLWIGLILLALAGAADVFGTVFRVAILQNLTPEQLQGRMGGTFFAAAVAGNRLGDAESGAAAAIGGAQFAVWSGGLACIVGTLLTVWRVPRLWSRPPAEDSVGEPL